MIRISSICSCGDEFTCGWSSIVPIATRTHMSIRSSSTKIAEEFMSYVMKHKPHFIVAHNCYSYDNRVLAYHLRNYSQYHSMFTVIRVKGGVEEHLSLKIDIPGINNIDSLVYINSCMGDKFPSASLANVSKSLNCKMKTKGPAFSISDNTAQEMYEYNRNDCEVLLEICSKLNIVKDIIGLCAVSSSPFSDVCVYSTGAMSWNSVTRYAISRGRCYIWPTSKLHPCKIRGGELAYSGPITVGYNYSLDFKSLYPNIIISCNISPECIHIVPNSHSYSYQDVVCNDANMEVALDWHKDQSSSRGYSSIFSTYKGVVVFTGIEGTVPIACSEMIRERAQCSKTNESRAKYLKIVNNSTYGGLGFSSYPSYSPSCAACVTAGGRWALNVLMVVCLIVTGRKPIYGDTDSCFTEFLPKEEHEYMHTLSSEHMREVSAINKILTNVLKYTPLHMLKVELVKSSGASLGADGLYASMMVVAPKMYAQYTLNADILVKGLASVRRSGSRLKQSFQKKVVSLVLSKCAGNKEAHSNVIRDSIATCIKDVSKLYSNMLDIGSLKIYEVVDVYKFRDQLKHIVRLRGGVQMDLLVKYAINSYEYESYEQTTCREQKIDLDIQLYKQYIRDEAHNISRCLRRYDFVN